jgi:hypothetical protein
MDRPRPESPTTNLAASHRCGSGNPLARFGAVRIAAEPKSSEAALAALGLIACAAVVLLLRKFPSGAAGLLSGTRSLEWSRQSATFLL